MVTYVRRIRNSLTVAEEAQRAAEVGVPLIARLEYLPADGVFQVEGFTVRVGRQISEEEYLKYCNSMDLTPITPGKPYVMESD